MNKTETKQIIDELLTGWAKQLYVNHTIEEIQDILVENSELAVKIITKTVNQLNHSTVTTIQQ